jgi:hypothetical protein
MAPTAGRESTTAILMQLDVLLVDFGEIGVFRTAALSRMAVELRRPEHRRHLARLGRPPRRRDHRAVEEELWPWLPRTTPEPASGFVKGTDAVKALPAEPEIADYIEAERPVSKYLDPAGVDAAAIVVAVRGQRFEFFNAHR